MIIFLKPMLNIFQFSLQFSLLIWKRKYVAAKYMCQIFTCSWFKADWCLVPSLMTVLIPTFKYWRVTIVSCHSSGILVAWCKDSSTKTTSSSVFFFQEFANNISVLLALDKARFFSNLFIHSLVMLMSCIAPPLGLSSLGLVFWSTEKSLENWWFKMQAVPSCWWILVMQIHVV